jgi:hypothetical protein
MQPKHVGVEWHNRIEPLIFFILIYFIKMYVTSLLLYNRPNYIVLK